MRGVCAKRWTRYRCQDSARAAAVSCSLSFDPPRCSMQLEQKLDELEIKMLTRLLAAALTVGFLVTGAAPAAIAQAPAKQHTLSTTSLQAQLKDEIARMTSLSPKEIEVHATNAMIRVVLVNTGYNDDPPPGREYLASTVSALVNKNAEKDSRIPADRRAPCRVCKAGTRVHEDHRRRRIPSRDGREFRAPSDVRPANEAVGSCTEALAQARPRPRDPDPLLKARNGERSELVSPRLEAKGRRYDVCRFSCRLR